MVVLVLGCGPSVAPMVDGGSDAAPAGPAPVCSSGIATCPAGYTPRCASLGARWTWDRFGCDGTGCCEISPNPVAIECDGDALLACSAGHARCIPDATITPDDAGLPVRCPE